MSQSVWGDKETQYFFSLTPDRILNDIERVSGFQCTGRALALNSMENRVYEIEIELDHIPRDPSERFLIAKFYRPGRWSEQQILDEHEFLWDLHEHEVPVVAPLKFNKKTLFKSDQADIYFAIFPKMGGRSPDELIYREDLEQIGRLLARLHAVGAAKPASHRITLTPKTYGLANLEYLLENRHIPMEIQDAYTSCVRQICAITEPVFQSTKLQRIHGDCHLGNLLFGRSGFYWVDFDDMVMGPCVQDLWLLIGSRDEAAQQNLQTLIQAYETMYEFDHNSLKLIEALRALRFVHFSAWIAKRWDDPAFSRAFPNFGTNRYWYEQLQDLREQLGYVQEQISH